jgi:hypothetical protein
MIDDPDIWRAADLLAKRHGAPSCQRALMLTRAKLYRDAQRPQCCALLKLPFPVKCSRRASMERRGRFYCGLHDPRRLSSRAPSRPRASG